MKTVDLRSDTVPLPPPERRKAIAEAELGDDVFGGDPTVNHLEAMAAKLMGKEAALLTTRGTQSNLTAMLAHSQRRSRRRRGAHARRRRSGRRARPAGAPGRGAPVQRRDSPWSARVSVGAVRGLSSRPPV